MNNIKNTTKFATDKYTDTVCRSYLYMVTDTQRPFTVRLRTRCKNIVATQKNIFFFALFCCFFTACTTQSETANTTTETTTEVITTGENSVTLTDAQFKNAKISTTTLQAKNVATMLQLNGKIDVPPQNLVSVSAPLGGYLRSTKLLPGMHVRKGEIIATIEDQQYIQLQQDYLLAKSKLNFAEMEYNRQKTLNQSQASSDKIMQQAEAEVAVQRIMQNALAEKLRLINKNPDEITVNNISKTTHIYSNINGFVSKINVNIGKYIAPTEVLFELINPTDIHLNLRVFEKDVRKLAIGQQVNAYTNSEPNKSHACKIILISQDINADGTADVHCHFQNYDKNLLPGMYMNATVNLQNQDKNTLPEASVVSFEGQEYVFVATQKQTFELVAVRTGIKENGFISIENANALAGKTIVTEGAYTLLMAMKNKEE
jgi:membrane fusion protein, heavy metal efflux system